MSEGRCYGRSESCESADIHAQAPGNGAIVSRHNRKKPKTQSASRLNPFHASFPTVEKNGPEEKDSPQGPRDRSLGVHRRTLRPSYCLTGCTPANPISSSPGKSDLTSIPDATQHTSSVELHQSSKTGLSLNRFTGVISRRHRIQFHESRLIALSSCLAMPRRSNSSNSTNLYITAKYRCRKKKVCSAIRPFQTASESNAALTRR